MELELSYINDDTWGKIKDKMPKTRGKSTISHRDFIESICWVANNDGSWQQLPKEYGNWQTARSRYRRWLSCGYIDDIIEKYLRYLKQTC